MKIKTKQIKHYFLYLCAIGISIFVLFFIITCTWIGFEIKNVCHEAKNTYINEQSCNQVLIRMLDDNQQSYKNRNDAIWALGQIGNPDSLPVLQKYYTGIIPNREPLNKTISQYELKKAINLAKGGTNISAFIWKCMNIE
jgi:hypothetical protein